MCFIWTICVSSYFYLISYLKENSIHLRGKNCSHPRFTICKKFIIEVGFLHLLLPAPSIPPPHSGWQAGDWSMLPAQINTFCKNSHTYLFLMTRKLTKVLISIQIINKGLSPLGFCTWSDYERSGIQNNFQWESKPFKYCSLWFYDFCFYVASFQAEFCFFLDSKPYLPFTKEDWDKENISCYYI